MKKTQKVRHHNSIKSKKFKNNKYLNAMSENDFFWQYPAHTEYIFYTQNKKKKNFIPFPWATLIDRGIDQNYVHDILKPLVNTKNNFTCCQHIWYYKYIPLWKKLNIDTVYISHKEIGKDSIEGIKLLACPIFALNIEDQNKNKLFSNFDKLNTPRGLLYSFRGAYNSKWYMSAIRPNIFTMKHHPSSEVENIGTWHLNDLVYSNHQNKNYTLNDNNNHKINTTLYNLALMNSKFSLCPSGSGPNSIRFWESLGLGSIPILLSDKLELPYHEMWNHAILRIQEKDYQKIPDILDNISENEIDFRRKNCIEIYNHFKNNFANN
jgi:hypothetical protein